MKTRFTYLAGLLLMGLSSQLLISCNPWQLPERKTQRNCQKPAGTINTQIQQRQVDFSINSTGTVDAVGWDFGNGSTTVTTGITPVRYTYPSSGTYVVTANLTNACETGTTIQQRIVISDVVLPIVTLQPVAEYSTTTATARMAVTSSGNAAIARYGVSYSATNQIPEVGKDMVTEATGSIAANTSAPFSLTGLQPNTLYYIRSFAQNSAGIGYSSPVQSFRTGFVPSINTGVATSVGATTASVIFLLNSPGNPAAVEYGIVYSVSDAPVSPGVVVTSPNVGANTVVNLTNLRASTKYYYRAYAKLPSGEIIYGTTQSFTTLVDAVVQDLVAHLTFANRSLLDLSGNNNNANLVNGPTFTADRKGNPNSAILLDGLNDYFYLSDNATLRPAAISISVWIKPTVLNGRMIIYNKSNFSTGANEMYSALIKPNEAGPGITINTDIKQDSNCQQGKWETFFVTSNIPLNAWHHLVFTCVNRSVRMYVDGALLYSTDTLPYTGIDDCPGGELKFGIQSQTLAQYFNGALDDIRIYKRALSASEVQVLYNE